MKVLIVGGYGELVENLADRREIEIFGTFAPGDATGQKTGGPYSKLFPYRPGAKLSWKSARAIHHAIVEGKPDIVHAFFGRPLAHTLLATWRMENAPKIVSFRGIATKASKVDPSNLITYLNPRVAAHACESDAVRQGLIDSGVSAEACVTTYRCKVPPSIDEKPDLRQFGIPPNAFVVGTIGNMRKVKGTDILLKAAKYCANLRNVYWLLIGQVKDRRLVRGAYDPMIRDRVILAGHRHDAVPLIRGADLFVMPSRSEGLCRALLEAMSVGTCPVVSDGGGMKEAVRHGVDGLVTPATDAKALASAIHHLYEHPEQIRNFGESAKQRVLEFFCPERIGDLTIDLYERVLNASTPDDKLRIDHTACIAFPNSQQDQAGPNKRAA